VWFRTPRRIGLAVDQWGPGLLTLRTPADGAGAGQVVLTSYGLEGTTAQDLAGQLHASWRPGRGARRSVPARPAPGSRPTGHR
jgi:hypothetical protein